MPDVRPLLLACISLAACTAAADQPAQRPATPATSEPPARPATPTQPAAPARAASGEPTRDRPDDEPGPGGRMPFPPGIITTFYPELADETLSPVDIVSPGVFTGPLARADECVAAPADCDYLPGVLGFHADGRVAVLEAPELPGCGAEDDPLASWGRVAAPDELAAARKIVFKPGKHDPTGAGKAARFVQDQARAGFTAPTDLIYVTGSEVLGIDGVVSLAILRAPLAGWLLHADDSDRLRLVDPANKAAHDLADLKGRGGRASIERVVLAPDRTTLWITISFNKGEHCQARPVSVHHYRIPAGVPVEPP